MNRRAFITGLIASTALTSCPLAIEAAIIAAPEIDFRAYYEQWMSDTLDVLIKCWEDQIIYGCSAHRYIETYPFVERIDPAELEPPRTHGGLFDD